MKRRLFFGVALVGLLWSMFGVSLVAGADETRPGGTTGMNFVTNKYVWTGDVTRFSAGEAIYHIEVQPGTVVRARWECGFANGEMDQMNGHTNGGEWDVSDATFQGAKHTFTWLNDDDSPLNETYCAYHVWRFSGSGGFRIVTAQIDFWLKTVNPGGGAGSSSSPGPGTSVSGSGDPPPSDPPGCAQGEEERVVDWLGTEYTFRVISFCPFEDEYIDRHWIDGVGCPYEFPAGRRFGDTFTIQSGETVIYSYQRGWAERVGFTGGGHVILPLKDSPGSGTGHVLYWNNPGSRSFLEDGREAGDHENVDAILSSGVGGVGTVMQLGTYGDTCHTVQGSTAHMEVHYEGGEVWLGPQLPSSGFPTDGDDVTPTPTPTASPSLSPSSTPPPPPPPWYFSPLPDNPDPGPNLGGNAGIVPPDPQEHNPTGMMECDNDDGTYSKPGQAPLQQLHDTSFPGSVNPLDYLPWVGNMLANVPLVISNIGQWHVNTGVDFVVPGPCVTTLIEEGQAALMEKAPFSLFADAQVLVETGVGGAGAGSEPSMTFAGTTVTADFSAIAENVAPFRPWMGAAVWLLGIIGILRLIAGTLGVSNGGGQS